MPNNIIIMLIIWSKNRDMLQLYWRMENWWWWKLLCR